MTPIRKRKKNNSPQEQIPADFLMMVVQLYSDMVKNARETRRDNKVEYKAQGLLNEIITQLQGRQPNIDVSGLFHNLHRMMAWQTFDNISHVEGIVQELQALGIEVPTLVECCFEEIKMRSRIVREYSTIKYQWSEERIQDWNNKVESKLLAYSWDNNSKRQYLARLFSDVVSEIKNLESEAVTKYGYYIDSFYHAGKFAATENDLNDFFFHSEISAGGYNAFHDIFLLLIHYIDKHNEAALLKISITAKTDADTPGITNNGEDYILPELLPRLKELEKKIHPQIQSWTKIKRAAWVDLLMDKGYFLPEYKRRKKRENCKAFAKARYKTNINTQMLPKEDKNRNKLKPHLEKYFKDV